MAQLLAQRWLDLLQVKWLWSHRPVPGTRRGKVSVNITNLCTGSKVQRGLLREELHHVWSGFKKSVNIICFDIVALTKNAAQVSLELFLALYYPISLGKVRAWCPCPATGPGGCSTENLRFFYHAHRETVIGRCDSGG